MLVGWSEVLGFWIQRKWADVVGVGLGVGTGCWMLALRRVLVIGNRRRLESASTTMRYADTFFTIRNSPALKHDLLYTFGCCSSFVCRAT